MNFSVDLTFPCIVEKKDKEYILQKEYKEYSFSASVLSCLSLYNDIYHAFLRIFQYIWSGSVTTETAVMLTLISPWTK